MRTLTTLLFLLTLTTYAQENNPIKLGLGIVALEDTYDETKLVVIYKDKAFKEKIEDFKLYGQSKLIFPYYLKPDYGICSFVCLEKTKDYFKILINDKEEGFLKNDNNTYFKTWEALLINSTVERQDAKSNQLKAKPGDNQETINPNYELKTDRLEVIDVIEINGQHWINVRFSKSGKVPCEKNTSDCGTGWIKWKSNDKLLVNILLLC